MEIERKYLISALPPSLQSHRHEEMEQCYLATSPTLRIRKAGDVCTMTFKRQRSNAVGAISNVEVEFPIPLDKYVALCEERVGEIVRKTRYYVPLPNGYTAELDVFSGTHEGLCIVEVEFPSLDASVKFSKPAWFGEEVSSDKRYRNMFLALNGTALAAEARKY
ncbi:MAG: CYTH domain-containing protein [Bacteroidales bacterium]|nr:CYTH domain-containing protein [Bacteroidales bacterium]